MQSTLVTASLSWVMPYVVSDAGHDMLMRLYHTRYSEQIETTDAATLLARWIA